MKNLFSMILICFAELARAQSFSPGIPLPGLPKSLGPKPMSQSTSVTLASDQGSITISANGNLTVNVSGHSPLLPQVRNDYTVTPVTTAAPVTLLASLAGNANAIEIFDSSGQTLRLFVGAANIIVPPGGNGLLPVFIPVGSSISIQAISNDAVSGEIDINFYD